MSSDKKTPTANKIIAILNLLFGGSALAVSIIGIFGYGGMLDEPVKQVPTMLPLLIISILSLIVSFVGIGAGFSLIKGEKSGIVKSRNSAIVFLVLFVFYVVFGYFALTELNVIGNTERGNHLVGTVNHLTSEIESEVLKQKLSDIRFNKKTDDFKKLDNVDDFTRWMITPMRVKEDIFKDEILKLANKNDQNFLNKKYKYIKNDRVYKLDKSTSVEDKKKIIDILLSIGYLRDYRIDTVVDSATISSIPYLFYLDPQIEENSWKIAYILKNEEEQNAKYYMNITPHKLIKKMEVPSKKNQGVDISLKKGENAVIKIDEIDEYGVKTNLLFSNIYVNEGLALEIEGKELINYPDTVSSEPVVTNTKKSGNELEISYKWISDSSLPVEVSIYKRDTENMYNKQMGRHDFLHKLELESGRDGVFSILVTYDKALPFSLISYILIFVITCLYCIFILLLTRSSSVKEWLESENTMVKRPEDLSQIAGLNCFIFPFIILLALSNLNGIEASPHFVFTLSGIIGIIIVIIGLIGLTASYSIISNNRSQKMLLNLYSYAGIIIVLINMVVNFFRTNFTPQTLQDAIELLYKGINPSINYKPIPSNLNAIFIAAGIIFFSGLLIIYPLYLRGRLKSENINDYFHEL